MHNCAASREIESRAPRDRCGGEGHGDRGAWRERAERMRQACGENVVLDEGVPTGMR